MALSTRGKIKEMISTGKADVNIMKRYVEIETKYATSKKQYRDAKEEVKEAKEKLEEAKAKLKETPFMKRRNIRRRVRLLRKKLESKEARCKTARETYKKRLKFLRGIRAKVREQSRACKAYESLFNKVAEAKKLGITIPKYIDDEVKSHIIAYRRARFSIEKSGITEIPMPTITCSRDISSLIAEQRAKNVKAQVQKVVVKVKKVIEKPEASER